MKTLPLTLALFRLVAALQAQDPLSLWPEEPDIAGTWYGKAIVANRNLMQSPRQAFPLMVTARGGVNFETKVTFMWRGGCYENSLRVQKTEEPSKYMLWNYTRIHIEELPVKDHYICYAEHQFLLRETVLVGYLMGRTPEENPEALEEFRKFTQRKRLPQKKILIPEERERCVPKHGHGSRGPPPGPDSSGHLRSHPEYDPGHLGSPFSPTLAQHHRPQSPPAPREDAW